MDVPFEMDMNIQMIQTFKYGVLRCFKRNRVFYQTIDFDFIFWNRIESKRKFVLQIQSCRQGNLHINTKWKAQCRQT